MDAADIETNQKVFNPNQQKIHGNTPYRQEDKKSNYPDNRREKKPEPKFGFYQRPAVNAKRPHPKTQQQQLVKHSENKLIGNVKTTDNQSRNNEAVNNILRQANVTKQRQHKGNTHGKSNRHADFGRSR